MRKKKFVNFILMGSLILSLAGCGGQPQAPVENSSELIELIEPVSAEISYEEVQRRTLYDYEIHGATVVPYIEEYSSADGFRFGSYGAFPGETVKKGQELIAPDTTQMDEAIKAKQEYIDTMVEDYQKYMEEQTTSLETYRWEEEKWGRDVKKLEGQKPVQFIDEVTGDPAAEGPGAIVNPDYTKWEADYQLITGFYRINKHKADTIELQMDQRTELYNLDLDHQKYLLKNMKKERQVATISTQMDGELVAVNMFGSGDWVQADKPAVAVGDMSQKLLKCDYINKATVKKAMDIYAVINGERYEVEYQAITNEEYAKLSANGDKVYSTFTLMDGQDVEIGDFAVITVLQNCREEVLTVPKGSVHKDEMGNFVYLLRDGQTLRADVQAGYSDGVYTEVLSGVEEGDKVVFASTMTPGANAMVLEKGEFHTDFSERGQMNYTIIHPLSNPVENGTVYFGEYQVRRYQHVTKGDIIATVRVEEDRLALTRNETKLSRVQERMADFEELYKDNRDEDYYKETVERYQEQIKDLEEIIAEQKKDFATKVIRADHTGVVVNLRDFKNEDIVQNGSWMVDIAEETNCYVSVQDSKQLLQYGNEVTITYKNSDDQTKSASGVVATMSKMGVSSDLQSDYSLILLPEDQISDMLQTATSNEWWNPNRYTVTATLRSMEGVVVIPRSGVYDVNGRTYVFVKDQNGNVKAQSFIAGGFNERYYWVVQGLTEGMEICLR